MEPAIAAMRKFNRFYTRLIGALDADFLGSEIGLPEARVLFEVATRQPVAARVLRDELGMDAGYLSRIVARFENRGWITRDRAADARSRPMRLTPEGEARFAVLDQRQREAVADRVAALDAVGQRDLAEAMARVRLLLDPGSTPGFAIRTFRTGDMGMIAARQSILYQEGFGWGVGMEVIEGEYTTNFLRGFKPGREQCWIAEVDGVMAGSIFLTDEGDGLCRLRLLYVEPFARRRGIGEALTDACIAFAREAGYARMTLWTHTVLEAARRIYADKGFAIVSTETHDTFGKPEPGETWELRLDG